MSFTQDNRVIAIETPLGKDVLLLASFTGEEAMSRLFRFELSLLSEKKDIDFSQIVGQSVNIRITQNDGSARYVNGVVSRFVKLGARSPFTQYQMEVVPWLWFLTRHADCRIFQNMTIPEIIENVFRDRKFTAFKSSLTAQYEKREYCVQYRETDFEFVTRLMEEYGIYYFFEHRKDQHTLVMADSPSACQPCPLQSSVSFIAGVAARDSEDVIEAWNVALEVRPGKYSMTDYNFETPTANMKTSETTVMKYADNDRFEVFDYPGKYPSQSQGNPLAKIRMQEMEAGVEVVSGEGNCRSFVSGYRFNLRDHPDSDMDGSYALVAVGHQASVGECYFNSEAEGESYSNSFQCIKADVPFRPPRATPRPLVHGPQTAVVVGPKNEEIWVDKYGRVKVQFFWDRVGKHDDHSSCWIRVSQSWAGKKWGAMWIPRIGQEVIVSFLEGDPDRPIITGRVYNADQEVPYELPEHGTRSTLLSRSSKKGGANDFNEIRFEDKKGSEQIFINAQRDMDLRVEKVSREYVGGSRNLIVGGDQKEDVGGSLHSKVGKSLNQKVGAGMSLEVGDSLTEKSGMNFAHEAGMDIYLKAGMNIVIEAGVGITLKAGGSYITLLPNMVAISGMEVLINSGGSEVSVVESKLQSPESPEEADDGTKGDKLH